MKDVRVILLDENAFFLSTLKQFLGRMTGISVIAASQSVVDVLKTSKHCLPDLLIFNLGLHAIHGREFCQKMKKESPGTTLIAYANVDIGLCPEILYPDIDMYLAQDNLFETLYPAICRLGFFQKKSQQAARP